MNDRHSNTRSVPSPSQPRLTIGMPVFNNEALVSHSIESLLGQTYGDFQLIISDNASTDGTSDICRSYARQDSRIRYVRQPVNRGSAWNFNEVFRMASSELFKWAAADDLCHPEFLERCVELLDRHEDAAWSFTQSTHIDVNGERFEGAKGELLSFVTPDDPRCGTAGTLRSDSAPHRRLRAILLSNRGCQDTYGVVRRAAAQETRLFLPYFGSEKVFMAELALRGRYAEHPEILFYGRIHPQAAGSLRTSSEQRRFVNPLSKRLELPRLQLLNGYISAVARCRQPVAEKSRCYWVVLRYATQFHKWSRVIKRTLSGRGLSEDRPELERPRETPSPGRSADFPAKRQAARSPACSAPRHR